MTIFYYLCDCINAAVRAWLALQLADAIFEPKLTRKRIYIGQVLLHLLPLFSLQTVI